MSVSLPNQLGAVKRAIEDMDRVKPKGVGMRQGEHAFQKECLVAARETIKKAINEANENPQERVFHCPIYPGCGCPDGTVAPDCPGLKEINCD